MSAGIERPDEPVVEEGNPASLQQQVVARVGVGGKQHETVEASVEEAEHDLAYLVALDGRFLERGHERIALDEFLRDDPGAAVVQIDLGHHDVRVAGVELGKLLLVVRLAPVVELLQNPLLYLVGDLLRVEVGSDRHREFAHRADVPDVGSHRIVDARVLDLDGNGLAARQRRSVNLTD